MCFCVFGKMIVFYEVFVINCVYILFFFSVCFVMMCEFVGMGEFFFVICLIILEWMFISVCLEVGFEMVIFFVFFIIFWIMVSVYFFFLFGFLVYILVLGFLFWFGD